MSRHALGPGGGKGRVPERGEGGGGVESQRKAEGGGHGGRHKGDEGQHNESDEGNTTRTTRGNTTRTTKGNTIRATRGDATRGKGTSRWDTCENKGEQSANVKEKEKHKKTHQVQRHAMRS
jgi:hypothetical protein